MIPDLFEGIDQVALDDLLEKAQQMGVDSEFRPSPPELLDLLMQLGAEKGGKLRKSKLYRAFLLVQERARRRRGQDLRARLQCLAQGRHNAGGGGVFGLPAFVECLTKLALNRLGSKGSSDIQRGSPAWWKCTWLLTLLGGQYREHVLVMEHAQHTDRAYKLCAQSERRRLSDTGKERIAVTIRPPMGSSTNDGGTGLEAQGLAAATLPAGLDPKSVPRAQKRRHTVTNDVSSTTPRTERRHHLDLLWSRVFTRALPRYVPQLDLLATEDPMLFEPTHAEALVDAAFVAAAGEAAPDSGHGASPPCSRCGEVRSLNGWGSPSCVLCGCVEELCLPLTEHLFGALLKLEDVLEPESLETLPEDAGDGCTDGSQSATPRSRLPSNSASHRVVSKRRSSLSQALSLPVHKAGLP